MGLQGASRCLHGSPGLLEKAAALGPAWTHLPGMAVWWTHLRRAARRLGAGLPGGTSRVSCPTPAAELLTSWFSLRNTLPETSTLSLHWCSSSDSCGNSPGAVGTLVSVLPPHPPMAGNSGLPWRNVLLWRESWLLLRICLVALTRWWGAPFSEVGVVPTIRGVGR